MARRYLLTIYSLYAADQLSRSRPRLSVSHTEDVITPVWVHTWLGNALRRAGGLFFYGQARLHAREIWQDRRKCMPVGVRPQTNLFSMSRGGRICLDWSELSLSH